MSSDRPTNVKHSPPSQDDTSATEFSTPAAEEEWALALLNECEKMDRETLLQNESNSSENPTTLGFDPARDKIDILSDEAIFVAEEIGQVKSGPSAIEKQLCAYENGEISAALTPAAETQKQDWRVRILKWFE